ncbi:hypothetical protein [Allosalinactinospora lopnorensis]|uniref:hypothetical protein n=1 Tax=Allosalinactinospora lopnorensis TaxID=1352348 RepID=UPI001F3E3526|nr:hypothetical protein [Allosalinactinospora lopnorensis]
MAAVLAVGTAGCSIDLSDWRPGGGGGAEAEESSDPVDAAPLLEEALDSLAAAPAILAQGQIGNSDGGEVKEASFTVTDSGATTGSVQEGESEAQVRMGDSKMFVQAPDEYWLNQGVFNPDSDQYGENWVRVDGTQMGVNPAAVLAPERLSEALRELAPAGGEATPENLDGTAAYRIDLAGTDNRVWVTEEEPHRLLRIEIEELVPKDAESGPRTRLNISEPETADVEQAYDDLIAWAEDDLGGARDARLEVAWDGQLDMQCETGGQCTVEGTVRDDSVDEGSGTVQVRMDASFENDELGEQECDDTAKLEAGGTVTLSCSVDYELAPSSTPQEYEIGGEGLLSTRGITGNARDELVETLQTERQTTLGEDESAEESPDEEGDSE